MFAVVSGITDTHTPLQRGGFLFREIQRTHAVSEQPIIYFHLHFIAAILMGGTFLCLEYFSNPESSKAILIEIKHGRHYGTKAIF